MNQQIELYLSKNYYVLLNIAKKITKQSELSQDLLHEIILQLYDKDEIKLRLSYEQEEFESEELLQLLEIEYANLDWFKKSLLDLYLSLNSSMKAVSRKTNIPTQSISRYMKETRNTVITNINNKLNG